MSTLTFPLSGAVPGASTAAAFPNAATPTRSNVKRQELNMRKLSLQTAQADVDRARQMAGRLVDLEVRGSGDTEGAMRRIETRFGVPFGAMWALRYRPPKRIASDILNALRAAYEQACQAQMSRLDHELKTMKATDDFDAALVGEVEALLVAARQKMIAARQR